MEYPNYVAFDIDESGAISYTAVKDFKVIAEATTNVEAVELSAWELFSGHYVRGKDFALICRNALAHQRACSAISGLDGIRCYHIETMYSRFDISDIYILSKYFGYETDSIRDPHRTAYICNKLWSLWNTNIGFVAPTHYEVYSKLPEMVAEPPQNAVRTRKPVDAPDIYTGRAAESFDYESTPIFGKTVRVSGSFLISKSDLFDFLLACKCKIMPTISTSKSINVFIRGALEDDGTRKETTFVSSRKEDGADIREMSATELYRILNTAYFG